MSNIEFVFFNVLHQHKLEYKPTDQDDKEKPSQLDPQIYLELSLSNIFSFNQIQTGKLKLYLKHKIYLKLLFDLSQFSKYLHQVIYYF